MTIQSEGFFQLIWGWLRSTVFELSIFAAVFLIAASLIDGMQVNEVVFGIKVVWVIFVTYGGIFLYWPISLGLAVALRGNRSRQKRAQFLFFVPHSWIALSVSYNGLYGLADHINHFSPIPPCQ